MLQRVREVQQARVKAHASDRSAVEQPGVRGLLIEQQTYPPIKHVLLEGQISDTRAYQYLACMSLGLAMARGRYVAAIS